MKLKGLLKGLCIFGLTLLPISFSSASRSTLVEFDIPDTKIINGSTILILNNLNFSSTYNNTIMNRVLYFPGALSSNGRNRNFSLFTYYNGLPYLFTAYLFDGNVSLSSQGFLQKVCVASAGSGLTYCGNDGINNGLQGGRLNSEDISVFLNSNGFTHGYFGRGDGGTAYALNIYCFSNNINDYCFVGNADNAYGHTTLSGSLGLNKWFPDYINTFNWSSSHFSQNSTSSIVNPRDSAQNIYDAYRSKGYSDTLCYVGFGLDNIISTGNSSFYDIQIGKGATIFQLYNYYSGGFNDSTPLNFVDWYNDWDFQYGFFNDYHDLESEYQYYIGKPKGFVGAFMIKDFYFKGNNFDTATLKSFCEFSLANDTLIDKTKSPIDVVSDTINENEINQLIGNIGIILPSEGSALDLVAGTLSGYQEQDFWAIVQSGYDIIDGLKYDTSGYPGILPTYIVVGFLLIFLVYVFKH